MRPGGPGVKLGCSRERNKAAQQNQAPSTKQGQSKSRQGQDRPRSKAGLGLTGPSQRAADGMLLGRLGLGVNQE